MILYACEASAYQECPYWHADWVIRFLQKFDSFFSDYKPSHPRIQQY